MYVFLSDAYLQMFQLPPNLSDPEFLAEGGFGTVAKCRVLNPAVADGHDTVAVKRVKITKKEDDWEDTLRLLREVCALFFS